MTTEDVTPAEHLSELTAERDRLLDERHALLDQIRETTKAYHEAERRRAQFAMFVVKENPTT